MIIMVTLWIPPHKAADVAKIFLKQPRKIPNVKKWRAFSTTGGMAGNKQYHLIYTERENSEEAIMEINKFFMPLTEIEGLRTQAEILVGTTDAFKLFGMKWE